ncbi:MAG TPA: TauD/TfdA family dioxygenase [Thermoanaerobaculia bacterium]|nr:TauD/TfdA family dioxygenase [Thermoanaerobaculia bacterium]
MKLTNQPVNKKLGPVGRRAVSTSAEVVETSLLAAEQPLPLLLRPAVDGVSLSAWLGHHRERWEELLRTHGALLFRGFGVRTREELEELAATASGGLMDYTYRSTPRSSLGGRVYTSTEYPADQSIPMHNEMSYTSSWPLKIWFFCEQPSEQGGETPLADSRHVCARLDPALRQRFAEKKVMYVRNYGAGLDLTWENVFQTTDRAVVESFCREAGIELEWKEGNRLRTRQRCQAVAHHPATGEMVWFNQAHLFHRSSLAPEVLAALLETMPEEDLPRDTCYGDGTPIEASALEEIRGVYAEESVAFPWQKGDVLMVDNMLVAHGRRPFSGPRKILVAMAEPVQGERA